MVHVEKQRWENNGVIKVEMGKSGTKKNDSVMCNSWSQIFQLFFYKCVLGTKKPHATRNISNTNNNGNRKYNGTLNNRYPCNIVHITSSSTSFTKYWSLAMHTKCRPFGNASPFWKSTSQKNSSPDLLICRNCVGHKVMPRNHVNWYVVWNLHKCSKTLYPKKYHSTLWNVHHI